MIGIVFALVFFFFALLIVAARWLILIFRLLMLLPKATFYLIRLFRTLRWRSTIHSYGRIVARRKLEQESMYE